MEFVPIVAEAGEHKLIIDPTTWSMVEITSAHYEVHEQNAYQCEDVQSVGTTTIQWMVTTPTTKLTLKKAHMLFGVECTGEMLVVVTEDADRDGTNLLNIINHDRNSSNESILVVHRAVSGGLTDGATTVFTKRTGATGVGSKTVGWGEAGHGEEYILKQNTKYIISVTTYAAVYVSLELDWYEHEDK